MTCMLKPVDVQGIMYGNLKSLQYDTNNIPTASALIHSLHAAIFDNVTMSK